MSDLTFCVSFCLMLFAPCLLAVRSVRLKDLTAEQPTPTPAASFAPVSQEAFRPTPCRRIIADQAALVASRNRELYLRERGPAPSEEMLLERRLTSLCRRA